MFEITESICFTSSVSVVQNYFQCMLEKVKLYYVIHSIEHALLHQALSSLMKLMSLQLNGKYPPISRLYNGPATLFLVLVRMG